MRLVEAERAGAVEGLCVTPEPGCWRQVPGAIGSTSLRPDLHVVLSEGDCEHHAFVEVDLGSEHGPALQRKCLSYSATTDQGWSRPPVTFSRASPGWRRASSGPTAFSRQSPAHGA